MSLKTQLWIAVAILMLLSLLVSIGVSTVSARNYLAQQLHLKNVDNAASLALSLTQLPKDDAIVELALAAQFDTGHYRLIRLTNPRGEVMQERTNFVDPEGVPGWFVRLMAFDIEPGVAHITDGWSQFGALTVESQTSYAYESLWEGTRQLALIFAGGVILIGLLGTLLLRRTVRPLDAVVQQAEAIGNRRFITVAEPATREFRRVVVAMNALSGRVRTMLEQEARRLEQFQRDAHVDKISGLLNRDPFLRMLDTTLQADDENAAGLLVLVRINGLADLNVAYGRKAIDGLLADMGAALNAIVGDQSGWGASRLNGSDFALLAPRAMEPQRVASEAQQALRGVLEQHSMDAGITLPCAATIFTHGATVSSLLTRLDAALQAADRQGGSTIRIAHADDADATPVHEQMERWRDILAQAFAEGSFSLATFPVVDLQGRLIHLEAPVRLRWEGETLAAGHFLPWIHRLEMSSELDRQVVDLALGLIGAQGRPVGINLSVDALLDPNFPSWLGRRCAAAPDAARQLWLELPEAMAFRHLDRFAHLCSEAKAFECRIGIEHFGHQVSEIGRLHDIGLDYLKADASFVRSVEKNPANQTLLRTLCTIGHSIGVIVIAEGVRTDEERQALETLGLDGVTGPGVVDYR
ncbi:bifunctional diguanylate cyclase/phosphodiesterase [Thioalkalivibrio paradoxus]|uniref:Cyclic diguanylate phosphodiesterase n=1 Tax=Thioalkalivibrio paradoxus ARh 1 TaxID=713585 RepID=W0DLP4_9GAMM|nr:EAL domain-containing protein [Thioalkalivibrio paradoxus]AHE97800.1 cyclic diguanylate phosphodiesterase [Thioalkalivibrio paradoxus ARh 1]